MTVVERGFCWALVTGEYPPTPGGVADYTRQLARALAAAGDRVHVLAPRPDRAEHLARDPGVEVHELPPGFGPRGLGALVARHRRLPRDTITVLQYTPHAFGLRGMNVPLCAWAARRARSWVMFHEVHFPFVGPLRHRVLSAAQQGMARLLARGAERTFVSTQAWTRVLERVAPGAPVPTLLPVPSNLSAHVPGDGAAARARAGIPEEALVVGHFGTYGAWFRAHLRPVLIDALVRPGVHVMLVGRGATAFAAEVTTARDRVHAVEGDPATVTDAIACCDLLVQPFPDGPTTRRGSLMAGLALGRPVVTNDGHLTDDVFRSGAVALAARVEDLGAAVCALLAEPEARSALGRRGEELYQRAFSLEHVVSTLRGAAAEGVTCASR